MIKVKTTKLMLAGLMSLAAGRLFAAYAPPASYLNPRNTVEMGSSRYRTDGADDSAAFQQAIDWVNSHGGGRVVVPCGRYQVMGISLKSDVHIVFESGVTLEPVAGEEGNLFSFGEKELIQNVSLIGPADRTVFDFSALSLRGKYRAVVVNDCTNLRLANLTINDHFTIFSALTFGWGGVRDGDIAKVARDVLVENITANNANYGYGSIQAHSGKNMIFRNIKSVGGVAVRLETGYAKMNRSGIGGLFNILVEDVTSINGQGALMMQAHTMRHGDVTACNVQADGSEFALYIANKFVSTKKYGEDSGKTAGGFASITVNGVRAVYRDGPNSTRYAHLRYFPKELHPLIHAVDNESRSGYVGPSIAAVANMQPEEKSISITNVEAIGFKYRPDIMTPADLYSGGIGALVKKKMESSLQSAD